MDTIYLIINVSDAIQTAQDAHLLLFVRAVLLHFICTMAIVFLLAHQRTLLQHQVHVLRALMPIV